MKYKQGKRFGLPHKKQSLIYFLCVNYKEMPQDIQHKISNLCYKCGGQHHQALFKAVTTDLPNLAVAMDYYLSESTISRLVKNFYSHWQVCD